MINDDANESMSDEEHVNDDDINLIINLDMRQTLLANQLVTEVNEPDNNSSLLRSAGEIDFSRNTKVSFLLKNDD